MLHDYQIDGYPLVSVLCIAYNHEKYIRKCIESILEQKTTFPFEVIVNDDCSTDSTQSILKDYEKKDKRIRVIYQSENLHSKHIRVLPILVSEARGKYISICECDDYFVDSYKLQKQYEFLENNKDCVACIHSALRISEDGNHILGHRAPWSTKKIQSLHEIIPSIGRLYSLNSLFCYKSCLVDLDDLYSECSVGDIPIALHIGNKGLFGYICEDLSAYRVGSIGSWSRMMQANITKAVSNTNNFIDTLIKFDRKTDYKYHAEIVERIQYFTFRIHYLKSEFLGFNKKEFKAYRSEMSFKQKLGFYYSVFAKNLSRYT